MNVVSADIGVGDGSAITMAWRLLEDILIKCEKDRLTILHKTVATRLLGLGVFLPNWLVMSYKVSGVSRNSFLFLWQVRSTEVYLKLKEKLAVNMTVKIT